MHATPSVSKQRADGTGLGAPADAGACLPASHVARGGGGGGGGLTNIGIASARALKMNLRKQGATVPFSGFGASARVAAHLDV